VTTPFTLAAVAYDPKVVTIWDGFRRWLRGRGMEFDYVLYSNYERQVMDLLEGRVDVAWNSPLAWVRSRRLADTRGVPVRPVAMRDTDCGLTSVVVVRADSTVDSLPLLRGRVVATGAVDSPQATLLPLSLLRAAGLQPYVDVQVRRFDVGVGLHGDHIGGERDAARALAAGDVDAACIADSSLLLLAQEGTLPSGSVTVVAQTAPYDHCNMTAGPSADSDLVNVFCDLLFSMSYADPHVRPLLDLEGLKEWRQARTEGYRALERAVDEASFYDGRGEICAGEYRP
jgi:phosphonate transport system substrate-binding protein